MQGIASRSGCTSVDLQVAIAAVLTAQRQHKAYLLVNDKYTRDSKNVKTERQQDLFSLTPSGAPSAAGLLSGHL